MVVALSLADYDLLKKKMGKSRSIPFILIIKDKRTIFWLVVLLPFDTLCL